MSEKFDPAPPVGRQPRTFAIGARRYRITPLPPRQALRVIHRVISMVGAPIGGLLSGVGLEVPGLTDADGEPMRLTLEQLAGAEVDKGPMLTKLVEIIAGVDPDDLDTLLVDLVVGSTEVALGAAWIPIVSAEQIDIEVSDATSLAGLVWHAFAMLANPTSAGGDTSDAPPAVVAATPGT